MAPQPEDSSRSTAPTTPFGRFVAAYRGGVTRAEAARRSGLPESRWQEVESSGSGITPLPPHTVAAMCVAVGADVATGLQLAGHDPRAYEYLLLAPPGLRHMSPRVAPRVANYRIIGDVLGSPGQDPRAPIGALYRETAAMNQQLADDLTQVPPDDGRREFWAGYAAALRALAEEQLQMAHQESPSA